MSSDYEEFSRLMFEDMEKAYSAKAFDHIVHPRNAGSLKRANGYGEASDDHGDAMQIWLQVVGGVVKKANFWTTGCTTLVATGSALTEMVKGLSIEAAGRLTPSDIIKELGGLPKKTEHCADIAVGALSEAIKSHIVDSFIKRAKKNKPGYGHFRLEL
ncbi:MAG: iron-sulfur cluster assembly scaffold protein [Chloroflexota bacterium]